MTNEQKEAILGAWSYCDEEDKSTEYMFQYMSGVSGVHYDNVVDYICSDESTKDRQERFNRINTENNGKQL
jgi:hypothetical protein